MGMNLKYIKYVNYHDYRTCIANAILLGTGVCIDFAITLYKCLTDLGYQCKLINGISSGTKEDINSKINIIKKSNHAWNQVKINDNWYNIDITWFLTTNESKWLLVSNKEFEEGYKHITDNKEHYCTKSYDRERLNNLLSQMNQYKSILKEFDKGNKEEVLIR